ncbi:CpaD family pilus assembly lipoprotein [Jiella sp. MQZ9-1]|uniref:CpaD family pilus assembly lipoprotein n=1 Tax=Jiella flava TaxID=2816857 RepID=A0A939G0P4_9HYPH|nr:CpaD family pilus assembly lipoprotein [Jiella flava]MBO0663685.1 CpaD family pilus assembly lipoprotein [Jiella flava]MCD2472258.1 CpaD family pilus assembly lipoprotein [Jiella flava]
MTTQTLLPRRIAGVRPALAGAALALLAGCANVHHVEVGAIPDDYRTRHPIIVSQAETAIDIPVTTSQDRLTLSSRSRVREFAQEFRVQKIDTMRVLVPYGSVNERAAEAVSRDVVKTLRQYHVGRGQIIISPYSAVGDTGPTPIRLAYSTLVAKTGPCGRWPEDLADTSENKNYFNFGCASQQNLAAQIADPRDLLAPRGIDPSDPERRTTVIDKYRNGENTSAAEQDALSNYDW